MKKQLFLYIISIIIASASTYGQTLKDTVVDIDGNIYHTVKIGKQTWMVENLRATHYRNGDSIPKVKDSKLWSYSTTGAYCDYNNDILEAKRFGKLYNWYAVTDKREIAPLGWHVPSLDEWHVLNNSLGGHRKAGGRLKETTFLHWISPNKGATNISGFLALPGGYRYYNGTFGFIGEIGAWWLSTVYDATEAWSVGIRHNDTDVGDFSGVKADGFSVRCIKDN